MGVGPRLRGQARCRRRRGVRPACHFDPSAGRNRDMPSCEWPRTGTARSEGQGKLVGLVRFNVANGSVISVAIDALGTPSGRRSGSTQPVVSAVPP